MTAALFIANYIIEYSNDKNFEINNLRLQKLLYYIYSRCLLENHQQLFDDKIQKWKFGPVVPDVYHEFKKYGAEEIKKDEIVREILSIKTVNDRLKVTSVNYNQEEIPHRDLIEKTIMSLSKFDPFTLVNFTHEQEIWKKYKQDIESGIQNLEYSDEEIQMQFENNPKERIWE